MQYCERYPQNLTCQRNWFWSLVSHARSILAAINIESHYPVFNFNLHTLQTKTDFRFCLYIYINFVKELAYLLPGPNPVSFQALAAFIVQREVHSLNSGIGK